eukprot:GHRR01000633.1.p1 GENE.GHRR01000633.1~~GHRR01000633.1.p1  ORF type:complete len:442 (+),score=181.29 GHRR01000633.1:365-1690(+)
MASEVQSKTQDVGPSTAGIPMQQAGAASQHQQLQQQQQQQLPQQQPKQADQLQQQQADTADVKVKVLEALNSAFCQRIYSTALQHLRHQFSFDSISQQFMEILEQDDPYDSPCIIAHSGGNCSKNRYRDVVPYDHNRVSLPPLGSNPVAGSTLAAAGLAAGSRVGNDLCNSNSSMACRGPDNSYINASFMSDPTVTAECLGYIATQGPLPTTVTDFWRMVAATSTSAIVMLTGLTDGSPTLGNSRPRCAPYFPDQEQDCLCLKSMDGNVTVTCVHKNNLDESVCFRQLEVVWAADPQRRLWINHYQYSGWPDYGVPSNTSSVLALCHALDGCRRCGCKIVVHCSAGVGRTGTFIAIDILLQRLHSLTLQLQGSVTDNDIQAAMDIPYLVTELRKQRRGTVQTGEQYMFIWQAVMDELEVMLLQQQQQEQLMLQQQAALQPL